MEPTGIMCDNQSCIKLFENLVFHDRLKNIDIRCHFIKDYKENLATEFDMKDLGQMHYFLGLEVWQQKGEIFLGKEDTLQRF